MAERALRVTAPGRANLIGNPSDLYGGAVLACTVPLLARVTLSPARATELSTAGRALRIEGPADVVPAGDAFDIARSVLRALDAMPDCRIAYDTEIPLQSGLGGSTALQVALLRALLTWLGRDCSRYELAEKARAVEREQLGIRCGYVDQYMCTFGGLQYVDLRGKEHETPSETHPFATVEPLAEHVPRLPFLLAYTGVRHHSGQVHAPIRERWERGEPAVVAAYERMAELARAGKRALLEEDWTRLGTLMNENHALQRQLGGSGEVDERLIRAALDAGALGAKLAGAGHGGTIAALLPCDDSPGIRAALEEAGATALYRPRPVPGVSVESA
jgi:galactokinase/mevalonate kinase-like predicted kinase